MAAAVGVLLARDDPGDALPHLVAQEVDREVVGRVKANETKRRCNKIAAKSVVRQVRYAGEHGVRIEPRDQPVLELVQVLHGRGLPAHRLMVSIAPR